MSYEIVFSTIFDRNLSRFNKKLKLIVLRKIDRLAEDPRILGKQLKGTLHDFWELKASKFRILYRILEAEKKVSIETIDLRGRIFKRT